VGVSSLQARERSLARRGSAGPTMAHVGARTIGRVVEATQPGADDDATASAHDAATQMS
jgi:hypothetical protein